jgi:tetratricopeptide (TPR) repeat protein
MGCVPSATLPTTGTVTAPPPVPLAKEKDLPKKEPQAATCVAFGNYQLQSASEPGRTAAQKEQLYDQARKSFQQAVKGDPHCAEAYRGLARVYQCQGSHDRAVTTYQEGIKAIPQNASLPFELGMLQAGHKDLESALVNLKEATKREPENRTYATSYAYCLARSGRYDESLEIFRPVVGEAQAQYNVARMLHHVKNDEACKTHLQLALQANPKLEGAQELLDQLQKTTKASKAKDKASGPSRQVAS